jgi:hypothetical protein
MTDRTLPGYADLRLTHTMWEVLNDTLRIEQQQRRVLGSGMLGSGYLTSPRTGATAAALHRRGLIAPSGSVGIYWALTPLGRSVTECYRGARHSPNSRIGYGDGRKRTVCDRCHRVLIGPAVPWPDAAVLDAIDGAP